MPIVFRGAKSLNPFYYTDMGGALDLPILTNFTQPFKSEA